MHENSSNIIHILFFKGITLNFSFYYFILLFFVLLLEYKVTLKKKKYKIIHLLSRDDGSSDLLESFSVEIKFFETSLSRTKGVWNPSKISFQNLSSFHRSVARIAEISDNTKLLSTIWKFLELLITENRIRLAEQSHFSYFHRFRIFFSLILYPVKLKGGKTTKFSLPFFFFFYILMERDFINRVDGRGNWKEIKKLFARKYFTRLRVRSCATNMKMQ